MADLNLIAWTASGVLMAALAVFGYMLRKMSMLSAQHLSRAERRVKDVGLFLSHVSQDLTHVRKAFESKVHVDHAHARLLKTASDLGIEEPEKLPVFIR